MGYVVEKSTKKIITYLELFDEGVVVLVQWNSRKKLYKQARMCTFAKNPSKKPVDVGYVVEKSTKIITYLELLLFNEIQGNYCISKQECVLLPKIQVKKQLIQKVLYCPKSQRSGLV